MRETSFRFKVPKVLISMTAEGSLSRACGPNDSGGHGVGESGGIS